MEFQASNLVECKTTLRAFFCVFCNIFQNNLKAAVCICNTEQVFLKILQNLQKNTLSQRIFFNKVAG